MRGFVVKQISGKCLACVLRVSRRGCIAGVLPPAPARADLARFLLPRTLRARRIRRGVCVRVRRHREVCGGARKRLWRR